MQNADRMRSWDGPRFVLLLGMVLLAASGCETVEVVEPPPPEPEAPQVVEEVVEVEAAPVLTTMVVRLHPGSDEAMPPGAVATVTLEGMGGKHQSEMPKGTRMARFDAIEAGRYDLRVDVTSAGVDIGGYAYFVELGEEAGDVTVQVDYQRATLVVEAAVETRLERRYTGRAAYQAGDCLGLGADDAARLDLDLRTDGDELALDFTSGHADLLALSGRLAPGSSPLAAEGAFESSNGITGGWTLAHLSEPSLGAVAVVVELDNPAGSCQTTLEFAGLLEDAPASGVAGSRDAVATVEVVGHGGSQAVTLKRDEPLARFDGLLVGPYDILVNVRHAGRTLASHQESVALDAGGARVGTTFETEWPLPSAAPLAARDLQPLAAHAFVGKSVVADGAPECTGSIALVDSTTLTLTAQDQALALKFDNFYGRILELSGTVSASDEAFGASGTYRSSDDSAGTWAIKRFAAPTPRSVALSVAFHNETDSCRADYLFAGVASARSD